MLRDPGLRIRTDRDLSLSAREKAGLRAVPVQLLRYRQTQAVLGDYAEDGPANVDAPPASDARSPQGRNQQGTR